MCEKCTYQGDIGICTNIFSQNYNLVCPGVEYKADIRECEFSKIRKCDRSDCDKKTCDDCGETFFSFK